MTLPQPPENTPSDPAWPAPYPTPQGQEPYGQPHSNLMPTGHQGPWAPPQRTSGLYQAAAIINWVVMGLIIVFTVGVGIFVAAWFIPMTILIHKGVRDNRRHTALAVCTLLFCNLISGILMLVDDGNRNPQA